MNVQIKIHNPYWEEVKDLPQADPMWGARGRMLARWPRGEDGRLRFDDDTLMKRDDMVVKYSWTVPTSEALDFIVRHLAGRSVVDFGAGTGYWAYLLSQLGVYVECYDKYPVLDAENGYHVLGKGAVQWHPVTQADVEELLDPSHAEQVLFLSWPPYDDSMAHDALKNFAGDTVIYVGEGREGCTGDAAFHELLSLEWSLVDVFLPVQWEGLHDEIYVYERRPFWEEIHEQPAT